MEAYATNRCFVGCLFHIKIKTQIILIIISTAKKKKHRNPFEMFCSSSESLYSLFEGIEVENLHPTNVLWKMSCVFSK